jgi:hypothetical protein
VVGHGVHSLGCCHGQFLSWTSAKNQCSDELEEERARKRTAAVVQETLKEEEGTAATATATSIDASTCTAIPNNAMRGWLTGSCFHEFGLMHDARRSLHHWMLFVGIQYIVLQCPQILKSRF